MYTELDRASAPEYSFDTRLASQYDVNLASLRGMGFSQQELETDVPPFEAIRAGIPEKDEKWIDEQVSQGYAARLTIAPSLQVIGLKGDRYAPGLIPRFDLKQAGIKKGSTVVAKTWSAYADKYPLHDNGLNERFSAAVLLTPAGMPIVAGEDDAEAWPPNQTLRSIARVETKIKALQTERIEQAEHGRRVVSAPIGHLIMAEAVARHTGERSFHHRNSSCLVHYYPESGMKQADSLPTLGRTGRHSQRLELGARMLFVANEVVVRALHIEVDKENPAA